MSERIFLDAPDIGVFEKKYLSKAVDSGYVSTVGPFVPEFEKKFAKCIGTKNAISTQSGTAAIHMALYEMKIGKGDEVIVPALSFVATTNPVLYVGAEPVFADVDPDTWCISPLSIEKLITKKTKAIIPVHLYGNPCDMKTINRIAKEHKIMVIEDATESLGAVYCGKFTGALGNFGCFSFNGNKTITTGGGGMVVSGNKAAIEHIKFLVNQARDEKKGYYHPEMGFNYRMTNIEAALGLAQLERMEKLLQRKRRINEIYHEELDGNDKISFQGEYEGAKSSDWLNSVLIRADIRRMITLLKEKNIPARRIFMPMTMFPYYRNARKDKLRNTLDIYKNGICLPSSTRNSEDDIRFVCDVINKILKGA
ncbi:MAG TPA: aminotransferase class V-fold PLP-dependent enzyme [Candidatus Omnitrophota bacterium]|nr:aminotransferase class V-fold PLP-dependent enzyme [Candidatus Omnitrophota bacterium]HPS19512.1 aminotransferase class V-fold PLP-dependent enzyme [Candidatus Omnitrophota bacterium]